MKIFQCSLTILFAAALLISPLSIYSESESAPTEKAKTTDGYKEITTEKLKSMIDAKAPMMILDARKKNDGGLIPGAKPLAYNATDKEVKDFLKMVPKDMMIVVYCSNVYCPVSKYLAKRLVILGYTNVYKYPDGLSGWLDMKYPVDPAN